MTSELLLQSPKRFNKIIGFIPFKKCEYFFNLFKKYIYLLKK